MTRVTSIAKVDPEVVGFIRFCLSQKGDSWPALYDEMCRVAGRRLYKGMGYDDLCKKGMSLGLGNVNRVACMVEFVQKVPCA